MDITAATLFAAEDKGLAPASEAGLAESVKIADPSVETVASTPLLSKDRKWALRFNADGTVTLILGMKDYGKGWFSAYFASLVAARLGMPIARVRLYYSATFPAVLQTPAVPLHVFHRCHLSPLVNAIADLIESMCDQAIEKGRSIFADLAGLGASDVGFDRCSGRFFVLEKDRSGTVLELAGATRRGASASVEIARRLRHRSVRPLPEDSLMPSAA
jgi:carbon-monoxide dehydrogenase large subunit